MNLCRCMWCMKCLPSQLPRNWCNLQEAIMSLWLKTRLCECCSWYGILFLHTNRSSTRFGMYHELQADPGILKARLLALLVVVELDLRCSKDLRYVSSLSIYGSTSDLTMIQDACLSEGIGSNLNLQKTWFSKIIGFSLSTVLASKLCETLHYCHMSYLLALALRLP